MRQRRPMTIVEPQAVDDHYVTVNDPTTVRHLLAGRSISVVDEHQTPSSPITTRPLSTVGGHGGCVVVRFRRRTESTASPAVRNRDSVLLFDKHQMERRAKHVNHRPSYRRLGSTVSDRYCPMTSPLVTLVSLLLCVFLCKYLHRGDNAVVLFCASVCLSAGYLNNLLTDF